MPPNADVTLARDTGPLPPDNCVEAGTCLLGTWINVTPSNLDPSVLQTDGECVRPWVHRCQSAACKAGCTSRGPRPPHPQGVWKSTDYGATWSQVNSQITGAYSLAVAGTDPATIWSGEWGSTGKAYRSTDGGQTFTVVGQGGLAADLYSITADPYDTNHLISGLHEADGIVESTDGGDSWHVAVGSNWPSGGISWYPFFVDTGAASSTRGTWFRDRARRQERRGSQQTARARAGWCPVACRVCSMFMARSRSFKAVRHCSFLASRARGRAFAEAPTLARPSRLPTMWDVRSRGVGYGEHGVRDV